MTTEKQTLDCKEQVIEGPYRRPVTGEELMAMGAVAMCAGLGLCACFVWAFQRVGWL